MASLTRSERIKLWFSMNEGLVGPVLLLSAGVLVGIVVFLLLFPTGAPTEAPGRVTGRTQTSGKWGNSPYAIVRTADGQTLVRIARGNPCTAGNAVVVVTTPTVWGPKRSLKRTGCAA